MNTAMVTDKTALAKVLIAGANNAGKTTLVNSLIFEDFSEVTPTIGVNFAQKIWHGEAGPINLSIWDLSGHERFRCLMPRFCQGAAGLALVFDVTEPRTLDVAGQWLEFISSWNAAPGASATVLVGNKMDLGQVISEKAIQTFCTRHQIADYIPCSAKTGKNVKLVFSTLCSAIQRHQLGSTEHTPSLVHSPT
jgi:small GTP-binding protein